RTAYHGARQFNPILLKPIYSSNPFAPQTHLLLKPIYSWHGHLLRMAASAINRKSCAAASGLAATKLPIACTISRGALPEGWQNLRLSGSTRLTKIRVERIPMQRSPPGLDVAEFTPAWHSGNMACALPAGFWVVLLS